MSKESYIGGDYIETTGGDNLSFAKGSIVNSSETQFLQKGEKEGVSYAVNQAAPSIGDLDLIKVVINTSYDVCHDEVTGFDNYENFWILEDKGKYYHWLNSRTNTLDKNKPDPLPVTLAGTDNFILKATFKTKNPIECNIRLKDTDNKFVFQQQKHPRKNKDEEHEITFSCTTKPYKDTARYLENFTLNFEFSEDGTNWIPMKSVRFCLYLTWKKPLFSTFDTGSAETMQIKCRANRNKENICETLLWLGCKPGGAVVTDDETMIDSIFDQFKSLKIVRRREQRWQAEGLGYWRNASMGSFQRGLRTLLRDGEARCGEWTDFFQHILLTQGLPVGSDTIGICTEMAVTDYSFPSNPSDPTAYSQTSSAYKPVPISYQFAVKNAIHSDASNPTKTTGDSPGQGNPRSQPLFVDHYWFYYNKGKRFYDASYGKTYNRTDSTLVKYCSDNLSSVFMLNAARTTGSIVTSNLHNYIRATKNLF
ncbi:MAG: hypothetical protein LBE92_05485 [Chryseobacterium sp.]|jgi:hypothetical protein|uniref:hypothetical protein n=1 Tax=Chryseobacterium sp. TaxID=1871047 RepID=UPI00282C569B|nr:hypothetical protein [Chryseobacterium sp.]MDR2235554.1 hypothetical protein [Chryseobacterium sp.]